MSTWAQPGRLRRPGRGLRLKKFKPQPIHLPQGPLRVQASGAGSLIGRLLNAGVLECSGQNLEVLLKLVAAREGISAEARLTAQNLLSNGRRREA
jgi:hypothetical protein